MTEVIDEVQQGEQEFEAAFAEQAQAAQRTPEQVAADTKAAEEAAAAVAKANEGKTPEQIEADRVAAETTAAEAVAKKKAEDDAAAALAARTPEEIEAERVATEAAAKKAEEDAAAKARADAEAATAAEAARKAAQVESPEAKAAREAFEASIKPYEPNEEEKKALDKFKKDFPEEALAVEAQLKAADRRTNAAIYAAVQATIQHVGQRVDPVIEGFTTESQERHFTALKTAHPDYDAVIAKIPDWIKTQPAYLQPAMQSAYDGGTTQDVLALVSDYKKATGGATSAAAAAAAAAEAAKVEAKRKADAEAAALAPVGGRRAVASTKGAPDPNDFDGAWGEVSTAGAK